MLQALLNVLTSPRPAAVGAGWIVTAALAEWIPDDVILVAGLWLAAATIGAAVRVTDHRDKSLLIQTVAGLTRAGGQDEVARMRAQRETSAGSPRARR